MALDRETHLQELCPLFRTAAIIPLKFQVLLTIYLGEKKEGDLVLLLQMRSCQTCSKSALIVVRNQPVTVIRVVQAVVLLVYGVP